MYPHTDDIAKDVTYVNVSHSTVKIFHCKRGADYLSTVLLRLIPFIKF